MYSHHPDLTRVLIDDHRERLRRLHRDTRTRRAAQSERRVRIQRTGRR